MDNGIIKTSCSVERIGREVSVAKTQIETAWYNKDNPPRLSYRIAIESADSPLASVEFEERWNNSSYARRTMLDRHCALLPMERVGYSFDTLATIEIVSDIDTRTVVHTPYYHYRITSHWLRDPNAPTFRTWSYGIAVTDVLHEDQSFQAEEGFWHGMEAHDDYSQILMAKHRLWLIRLFG